jgi:ubiquinone/menaquinone biosynthesis C-methylase UbiE
MKQREIFLTGEGNAWFQRNSLGLETLDDLSDIVVKAINFAELSPPQRILEIGCADGARLKVIKKVFPESKCYGIDPSDEAIDKGKKHGFDLQVGTADNLPFERDFFDVILFGFSLYLCDRGDLFKIAYEADRCLCNKGYLIIKDFQPPFPYKNGYVHYEGLSSFKMDYASMFTWNPSYTEIFSIISGHHGYSQREIPDERIGVKILYKSNDYAYPHKIQWD